MTDAGGWIHVPAALGASTRAGAAQRAMRARTALREAVGRALGPFEALLGWDDGDGGGGEGQRFLLGTEDPCSADCVLAAHAALALARGPGDVVRGAMEEEAVAQWEGYVRAVTAWGASGTAEEKGEKSAGEKGDWGLPWREPRARGAWAAGVEGLREVGRSALAGAGWGGVW